MITGDRGRLGRRTRREDRSGARRTCATRTTAGSKKLGPRQGYRYAHDEPFGIAEQQYAPDVVADATYYRPTSLGAEAALKERWERVRRMIRGQRG